MVDERLTEVKNQEKAKLAEVNATYDTMINNTDQKYNSLIDEAKQYGQTQQELQQQQSDLAIEQVNQNKELAEKDYTKEQKGAYSSFTKATDKYGAVGERITSSGLAGSGYSETVQSSMYNTYQQRYAVAKESFTNAITNYNNSITQAQLSNSVALADIAYNTLQTQLSLALEAFQYKNTLLESRLSAQLSIENLYSGKYQDVLSQLNQEAALAEEQRQYNLSLAEQQRQYNASLAQQRVYNASLTNNSGGLTENYSAPQIAKTNAYSASEMRESEMQAQSVANSKPKGAVANLVTDTYTNNSTVGWKDNWRYAVPSNVPKTYTLSYLLNKGILTTKVVNGKTYYKAK